MYEWMFTVHVSKTERMKHQSIIVMCNDIHTHNNKNISERPPVGPFLMHSYIQIELYCAIVYMYVGLYFIIKCIYLILCTHSRVCYYLLWILSLPNNYCYKYFVRETDWLTYTNTSFPFFFLIYNSKVDFTFFPLSY